MKTKPQKTQLQRANEALAALKPNITSDDRTEAAKRFSVFTIVMYLKGQGRNLDTAIKLLDFFKGKIETREHKLTA